MNTITNNGPVVNESDVVFVSVKPGVVPTVLQEIKAAAANKLFVSVAMGVTIAQIENVCALHMSLTMDHIGFHKNHTKF